MKTYLFQTLIINSLLLLLIFADLTSAQNVDIIPYLKQIEKGEIKSVKDKLPSLKKDYPDNPDVMFLEGVLTENGQEALEIYQNIVDKYPNSKYADAALYRIYSYYYALGLYGSADKMLSKLKQEYPGSPYNNMVQKLETENEEVKSITRPDVTEKNEPDEDFKFTVQAGAFTNPENANGLRDELSSSGVFTLLKEKTVGGTIFHVVYAGRFKSRNEAESFLKILNDQFNIAGRVTDFIP